MLFIHLSLIPNLFTDRRTVCLWTKIFASHSGSFKVIWNYTDECGVCKLLSNVGLNICPYCIVNDIFSVQYWRDLEIWIRSCSRSLKMAPNRRTTDHIRLTNLLLIFHCNYGRILYGVWNNARYWSKNPNFPIFHASLPFNSHHQLESQADLPQSI